MTLILVMDCKHDKCSIRIELFANIYYHILTALIENVYELIFTHNLINEQSKLSQKNSNSNEQN